MKIITASKFYYKRGGLESYLFKITDILQNNGHEIIPFSTTYPENLKTDYNDYFAEYIDLSGSENKGIIKILKASSRLFYNIDAKNKVQKLIKKTNPDVFWGFGIHHQLSPSVFAAARELSIPTIHRLSDYGIICPDSRLVRGDGRNCTELLCPLKGYYNAVKYKCVRQAKPGTEEKSPSLKASIIGAMEVYYHYKTGLYFNNVDKFIAPSKFLMEVMIKSGINPQKITHIPIFIDTKSYEPQYDSENYFLYFGRLSEEKGLTHLLEAMKYLRGYKLIAIGDGPQREILEKVKESQNLDNIEFLGAKYGDDLSEYIKKARFVVVPSTWFDNSPNVILEAYACGKPVLGANIGGIPEYIQEGKTGLLYNHDNIEQLKEKIDFLMKNPDICSEMGRAARSLTEEEYNPDLHYQKVYELLQSVV